MGNFTHGSKKWIAPCVAVLALACVLSGCSSEETDKSNQKIVETSQGSQPAAEQEPAPTPVAAVEPEPEPEPDPDEGKSWQQIAREGDGHRLEQNADGATERFEKALEMLGNDIGVDSPEAAALRLKLGVTYFNNSATDSASSHFTQALSILEHRYGPLDERVLPALRHLIAYRDRSDEPAIAEVLIRRYDRITTARATRETLASDNREVNQDVRKSAAEGDASLAKFDYESAVSSYEEALTLAREKHGSDSAIITDLLLKVARASYNNRSSEQASNYWREALSNLTLRYGPLDARLRPALNSLVAYYDEQGEYEKAEFFVKRLELVNRKAGSSSTPSK